MSDQAKRIVLYRRILRAAVVIIVILALTAGYLAVKLEKGL